MMKIYVWRSLEGVERGMEGKEMKWVRKKEMRDYKMNKEDEKIIKFMVDMIWKEGKDEIDENLLIF